MNSSVFKVDYLYTKLSLGKREKEDKFSFNYIKIAKARENVMIDESGFVLEYEDDEDEEYNETIYQTEKAKWVENRCKKEILKRDKLDLCVIDGRGPLLLGDIFITCVERVENPIQDWKKREIANYIFEKKGELNDGIYLDLMNLLK